MAEGIIIAVDAPSPHIESTALVIAPAPAPVRKERGKYKKDRDARKGAFLTAEEAVQAAAAEGLELQRSDNSTSGFRGVLYRPNIKSKPFLVKHWVGSSYKLLGAFPTGEEAALTFARAKRDAANASANALAASGSTVIGEDGQPIDVDPEPPAPKRARKLTRPLHSWSTEDDQRLLALCQGFHEKRTTSLKTDWEPVAEKMGGFCSASAMKLRWRMLAGKKVGAANGAIGQRAAGIADGSILPSQLDTKRRLSGSPHNTFDVKSPDMGGGGSSSGLTIATVVTDNGMGNLPEAASVEATIEEMADIVAPAAEPASVAPAVAEPLHEHMPEPVPALESAQYHDTVREVPPEMAMEVPPAIEDECHGEDGYGEVPPAVEAESIRMPLNVGEDAHADEAETMSIEVPAAVPADGSEEACYPVEVAMEVPPAVPMEDGDACAANGYEVREIDVAPTVLPAVEDRRLIASEVVEVEGAVECVLVGEEVADMEATAVEVTEVHAEDDDLINGDRHRVHRHGDGLNAQDALMQQSMEHAFHDVSDCEHESMLS